MAHYHAEYVVRTLKGSKDSVNDMIAVLHAMRAKGTPPEDDGIRRSSAEEELDISLEYRAKTSLEHLVDINLVDRHPKDYDDLRTFVIADWIGPDGEIVNGRVAEVAEQGIESLTQNVRDADMSRSDSRVPTDGSGNPLRGALSSKFGVPPADVEDTLRSGDLVDNLRDAVTAIREHPTASVRGDYGMILFRNQAYRYRLSETANTLYRL